MGYPDVRRLWIIATLAAVTACQATAPDRPPAPDRAAPARTGTPIIVRDDPAPADTATPDPWRSKVLLYGWLIGIDGTVTRPPVGAPINASFGDIVDNLNGAFMAAFVTRKGRWGVQGDLTWSKLDVLESGPITSTDFDLEMLLGEVSVLYNPESAPGLDFLVGARVFDLDQELRVGSQPVITIDDTVVDPILGAQGAWSLGESWRFGLRGDVGGFGAASTLTYQVLGMFHWQFADAWGLDLGYRLIGYDITEGGTTLNMQLHGPLIGVDFRF